MPPKKKGGSVGTVLIRQRFHRSKGYEHSDVSRLHTLDGEEAPGLVSVIDRSDLDELMHAAELADREFTAERGTAHVVLSSGDTTGSDFSSLSKQEKAQQQKAEEELYQGSLKIPRRPAWNSNMTPEELDENERRSFLEWRRGLASLEDNEKLVLTPFEKNLDIWRQLWRVLERSDVIVAVVDARNPLFYRCLDLEAYVRELDPSKKTMLLLNKADLLPISARKKWADYLTEQGIGFLFWSAKEATEVLEREKALKAVGGAPSPPPQIQEENVPEDERLRCLSRLELLERLEAEARVVLEVRKKQTKSERAAHSDSVHKRSENMAVVGFVGYPNVGKSSTVNALVGQKKTGVTSTPGKTKHFQTLLLGEDFMLCDCPGLVFPSFSSSRSEMVAAGVLPIDRLTDQRGPVEIVAERVKRNVLEEIYGLRLPLPAAHERPDRAPTAAELLRAYARSRGYVASSGLPDETRASRQILKDYLSGKLLDYQLPPGEDGEYNEVEWGEGSEGGYESGESEEEGDQLEKREEGGSEGASSTAPLDKNSSFRFDDLTLSGDLEGERLKKQPLRAAHKIQKKGSRKKDRTWRVGHGGKDDSDGMPLARAVQKPVSHGAANLATVLPVDRAKIGLT